MKQGVEQKDSLTGAYARAGFETCLQREIEQAYERGVPASLLIIDLDHFKSINDAFGHARGDEVLAELAKRVSSMIRTMDYLFRYGGDEFVLLLPETSVLQAQAMGERLLDRVRKKLFKGNPPISLSLSIGVADSFEGGTAEELFEKADYRLLIAKRLGRGRVVAHDSARQTSLLFHEISRLVEREGALEQLNGFFEKLPEVRQGIMEIAGQRGTGRTCFLEKVMEAARLRGFEVLSLKAHPMLQARLYGALLEAGREWTGRQLSSEDIRGFTRELLSHLKKKGKLGFLIAIDDMPHLDLGSMGIVREILASVNILQIGLVYTTDQSSGTKSISIEAPYIEMVEIGPFTQQGARIWLRELLQWEPEEDFLGWLYEECGGYPARLRKGLVYLAQRGKLEHQLEGWRFNEAYDDIQMGEWLDGQGRQPQHNFPPLTPFVGRDAELGQLKGLLLQRRLVTVLGSGGIGKTRLALQAAAESLEEYRHGIYFVELAPLERPEFILSTIADAIGYAFYGGQDPKEQLLDYLRERQMLLLLDNFDHLLDGAGLIAEIIHETTAVSLLVTSRQRLNLPNEAVYELGGLVVPDPESGAALETCSAVQLFMQIANQDHAAFTLQEEEKPYLIRILKMVEGMPLGIELAASWVGLFNLKEMAEQIERNLNFLAASRPDLPERHRSLRAVFDQFWGFLSQGEKGVLRKLSIFRGGFRRMAAEQVAGASFFFLSALVDKSFLRRDTSGRYQMHEVLRQYAEEELAALSEEHRQASRTHSEYYVAYIKERGSLLRGEHQKSALIEIRKEIENVRRGWNWAVISGDIEGIERSLVPLFRFYEMANMIQEAEEAIQRVDQQLREYFASGAISEEGFLRLLGKVMVRKGRIEYRFSRHKEARELLAESLSLLGDMEEPEEIAYIENGLGEVAFVLGDYDRALSHYQNALEISTRCDDAHWKAMAYINLAIGLISKGELEKSEEYLEMSLQLLKKMRNRWGIANALINLGNIAAMRGDLKKARLHFEESLLYWRETGDQRGMANTFGNLGRVAYIAGDYREAKEYCWKSIEFNDVIGNQWSKALALVNLGYSEYELGEYRSAKRQLLGAINISLKINAVPMVLQALVGVAALLHADGNMDQALELLFFAQGHPAADHDVKSDAANFLKRFERSSTAEALDQSHQRAAGQALEDVLAELVENDLSNAELQMVFQET